MKLALNQKFRTMSDAQRRAVLSWARSHDWGGKPASWTADFDLIASGAVHDGVNWTTETGTFSTLREIRDWAGY